MSISRSWIIDLHAPLPEEISDPVAELGRKAASLRRLIDAGCDVPRGFTIRAAACRYFLDVGEWPQGLWAEVLESMQRLERDTGRRFAEGDPPLLVAVRSGAEVSMPGMLLTVLDCEQKMGEGGTSAETPWEPLRSAITQVFQSWNSEPARAYRRRLGIDDRLGTAVTVQEMIGTDVAGVMFTASPDIVVEAVEGSGSTLVSGITTPVQWLIPRTSLSPRPLPADGEATLSRRLQDFSEGLLEVLCRQGLKLEEDFGEPLDIEWGAANGRLVYFQIRPLAPTRPAEDSARYWDREQVRLRRISDDGSHLWVRHNLSETLPAPTPLTWSLWRQFMTGDGALGRLYRTLGYAPSARVCRDGFLELIGGAIYADPSRAIELFCDGLPLTYDPQALRDDPSSLDRMPTHFDPGRSDPLLLWKLPRIARVLWRAHRQVRRLMLTAGRRFEEFVLPAFLKDVARERSLDLSKLTDAQLLELFTLRERRVLNEFGPESLLPGMLGGIAAVALERRVIGMLGAEEGRRVMAALLPAADGGIAARQRELLQGVGRDASTLSDFMQEFGHRTIGEMELRVPRWRETPQTVLALARSLADGSDISSTNDSARRRRPRPTLEQARRMLKERLQQAGALSLMTPAEDDLVHCWQLLPYRERGKHFLLMGYELIRDVIEELARRRDIGDDIYFLTRNELLSLCAGGRPLRDWSDFACERRADWRLSRQLDLPTVLDSRNLSLVNVGPAETEASSPVLQGRSLSRGRATGRVWKSDDLTSPLSEGTATILACRSLDPTIVPLLSRMAGVIVQHGGTLSHGAVIARELGLPAVALDGDYHRLPAGARVHLDGESAQVQILADQT